MTVLVDTCVLIDILRRGEGARAVLQDVVQRGERIIGSVLTRTEVIAGTRDPEERDVAALLSVVGWIPVSQRIADRAGRYAQEYGRSHCSIDLVDYIIAATTDVTEAVLLTRNVEHFPMFEGLRRPY